jgi:large subunit ribosomal protein L25
MPKGVEIVALTHGEDHDTGVAAVHKTREVADVDPEAPVAEEGDEEATEE